MIGHPSWARYFTDRRTTSRYVSAKYIYTNDLKLFHEGLYGKLKREVTSKAKIFLSERFILGFHLFCRRPQTEEHEIDVDVRNAVVECSLKRLAIK